MRTEERRERSTSERGGVVFESRLVDDAVAEGLAQLGLTREEADIEVIDEGTAGDPGTPARVRVSRHVDMPALVSEVCTKLLSSIDETVGVDVTEDGEGRWNGEVRTEQLALVLGRRGRTIDAVQVLAEAIASRRSGRRVKVLLDSSGFREKRREALVEMAVESAKDAVDSGTEIHLDPMSSYDRKIIHSALSENDAVETFSEDQGDYRHIVIRAKGAEPRRPSRGDDRRDRGGRGRGRSRGGRGRGRGERSREAESPA